jgi:hypothetical protein
MLGCSHFDGHDFRARVSGVCRVLDIQFPFADERISRSECVNRKQDGTDRNTNNFEHSFLLSGSGGRKAAGLAIKET